MRLLGRDLVAQGPFRYSDPEDPRIAVMAYASGAWHAHESAVTGTETGRGYRTPEEAAAALERELRRTCKWLARNLGLEVRRRS